MGGMSNGTNTPPNNGMMTRTVVIGVTVFLFAAIGGFAIYNTFKSPAEKEPVVMACEPYGDQSESLYPRLALPVGSKAPDFTLKSLEGETVTLRDALKEKPVLVELFAVWCSHCQETAPILKEVQKEFGDQIAILAIDAGGEREGGMTRAEYLQVFQPEYVMLDAATGQTDTGSEYCLTSFPTLYLVNQRQVVKWRSLGSLDEEKLAELKAAIRAL